ncbi:hypothetical protein CHU98_g12435, partial [Xylaria longipes]
MSDVLDYIPNVKRLVVRQKESLMQTVRENDALSSLRRSVPVTGTDRSLYKADRPPIPRVTAAPVGMSRRAAVAEALRAVCGRGRGAE